MTTSHAQAIIDKIFSYAAVDADAKAALVARYNRRPVLAATKAGIGQQCTPVAQTGTTISSIPSQGIVIDQPGTYYLGPNVIWAAPAAGCAAITIACDNVTLDLAGNTLAAAVPDNSQQVVGILVQSSTGAAVDSVTIGNGTLLDMCFYGIQAENVTNLTIANIVVSGMNFSNSTLPNVCPAGIHIDTATGVTINTCIIGGMNVTSASSAGIQILNTTGGWVTDCRVGPLTNQDGSAQGYSYITSRQIITTNCSADGLTTHYQGGTETIGHTCIGFVPMLCIELSFESCSASNITGCCDDAHGMSVFIDALVEVKNFIATKITDGVASTKTGAKATGLEVYGCAIYIENCTVSDITAIVPQDLQSAGFSAWGDTISFTGCSATNVVVTDQNGNPDTAYGNGVGYGWAPDPRWYFCHIGASNVQYQGCTATDCQVGFDSWYHINSTWANISYPGCGTGILKDPTGTRTLTANACSECNPPISVTLSDIASGNTFPS
jgi:hypothetical protein